MTYYRGMRHNPEEIRILKPKTHAEDTRGGDCPIELDWGGYPISDIPQSSFSKSLIGAVLGSVQSTCLENYHNKNLFQCKIDIYVTDEEPDEDLSDCPGGDFSQFEEVRYNRTIPIKRLATISVEDGLLKQLESCYPGMVDPESEYTGCNSLRLSCLKDLLDGNAILKTGAAKAIKDSDLYSACRKEYEGAYDEEMIRYIMDED
jgi:hypothetical protein